MSGRLLLIFFLWDPKFPGPATYFSKYQIIAAVMLTLNSQLNTLSKQESMYAPRYYYLKENGKGTQTFRKH